jgi:hypothetical protein
MGNQYFIACGKRTRFYRMTLLGRGIRFADELNAGDVPINGAERSAPDRRFGGMGISEIGREGAKEGIEEFLQIKNVAISLRAAMRCRGKRRAGARHTATQAKNQDRWTSQ